MSSDVLYAVAYDHEEDNPNPHPVSVEGPLYKSETDAEDAAREDAEQLLSEGYSEGELTPWQIVSLPGSLIREDQRP